MKNIIAAVNQAALGIHRANGRETFTWHGSAGDVEVLGNASAYQPLVMQIGDFSQKELACYIECEASQFTAEIARGDTFTREDGRVLTVRPTAENRPMILPVGDGVIISIHTTIPISEVIPKNG